MQLDLYYTADADYVIGKTKVLEEYMDITLKRDTDLDNPVIPLVGVSDIDAINYAGLMGKFYFIRNVKSLNNSVWELSLEIDLLETYKNEILASSAKMKRSVTSGDYGEIDLDTTGREIITNYGSDVELDVSEGVYLSLVRGYSAD